MIEFSVISEYGMTSFLIYVATGAIVGLAVGVTGVGGGSLMTPALLFYGFPPAIAIGTDLLFASITKTGGAIAHMRLGNVDLKVLAALAAGSVPGALLALLALWWLIPDPSAHESLLTHALGFMLICTAVAVMLRPWLQHRFGRTRDPSLPPATTIAMPPGRRLITFGLGLGLGVLVTFSSVGTGAVAAAVLMLLFPALQARRIVGTDIAHAVPLTLIAGLGHLSLGNVDLLLLLALLCGSLPAIQLGARLSAGLPERTTRGVLVTLLAGIGGLLVVR